MRFAAPVLALTTLALLTAGPAHAQGDAPPPPPAPDGTHEASGLLRAADGFDRRAAAMRARSERLHGSALALRQEAEDLFKGSTEELAPAAARQQPHDEAPPADPAPPAEDTTTNPCGSTDDWGRRGRHGDGDGGGDDGDDEYWEDVAEACQLLATADRLDRRADALTVAADRMSKHACALRDKAAAMLASAGEDEAQRLLRKAAKLRARAAAFRATADAMRDGSFEGTEVVDAVVTEVERLEVRAAQLDAAADRLEARAAAASAS